MNALEAHPVRSVEEFAEVPGSDDVAEATASLWESGASRPGWCFVVAHAGNPVGRVGFRVAPTTTDPRWLGTLPPEELFVFGLEVPWDGDYLGPGRALLADAAAQLRGDVPDLLEVRINNEWHPNAVARRRLLEACGMGLFHEKQGFGWVDDGAPLDTGDRLTFRSIDETGDDVYRAVMAPCGEGTLDRNDRYYWEGCGPENWAAQMTAFVDDDDRPMWLTGWEGADPVGYIAVSTVEEWGSTIAHVGVVPQHRGNGYIHDLLAAGALAARRSGISTGLSDVDVVNEPMMAAMRRAGHRDDLRPWHVWVYRAHLGSVG